MIGFYNQNYYCYLCPYICSTCVEPALCLTCVPLALLNRSSCNCSEGTFFKSPGRRCQYCQTTQQPLCIRCSSISQCDVLGCKPYSFRNQSSAQCKACPPACSTCSSSILCLTCVGQAFFNSSLCYCIPMFQVHLNVVNTYISLCQPCPERCLSCTQPVTLGLFCTSCQNTFTLSQLKGGFACTCPQDGRHQVSVSFNLCCPLFCSTCSSNNICLICRQYFQLYGAECRCKEGMILNPMLVSCQPCLVSCMICQNGVCLECPAGKIMKNGYCYQQVLLQVALSQSDYVLQVTFPSSIQLDPAFLQGQISCGIRGCQLFNFSFYQTNSTINVRFNSTRPVINIVIRGREFYSKKQLVKLPSKLFTGVEVDQDFVPMSAKLSQQYAAITVNFSFAGYIPVRQKQAVQSGSFEITIDDQQQLFSFTQLGGVIVVQVFPLRSINRGELKGHFYSPIFDDFCLLSEPSLEVSFVYNKTKLDLSENLLRAISAFGNILADTTANSTFSGVVDITRVFAQINFFASLNNVSTNYPGYFNATVSVLQGFQVSLTPRQLVNPVERMASSLSLCENQTNLVLFAFQILLVLLSRAILQILSRLIAKCFTLKNVNLRGFRATVFLEPLKDSLFLAFLNIFNLQFTSGWAIVAGGFVFGASMLIAVLYFDFQRSKGKKQSRDVFARVQDTLVALVSLIIGFSVTTISTIAYHKRGREKAVLLIGKLSTITVFSLQLYFDYSFTRVARTQIELIFSFVMLSVVCLSTATELVVMVLKLLSDAKKKLLLMQHLLRRKARRGTKLRDRLSQTKLNLYEPRKRRWIVKSIRLPAI